jgi:hypothetical protein
MGSMSVLPSVAMRAHVFLILRELCERLRSHANGSRDLVEPRIARRDAALVSLQLTGLGQQQKDRIRRGPQVLFDPGCVAAHARIVRPGKPPARAAERRTGDHRAQTESATAAT